MDFTLFGGSTINIIIAFAIIAFALVAIFTDSTPVKWVASLLAIAGMGFLYKRLFPSDSEIKRKYEENEAAVNQYYEDRKKSLNTINENNRRIKQLESEKKLLNEQDENDKHKISVLDTEINQLENKTGILEKSVDERQKKLDKFFSRRDKSTAETGATIPYQTTGSVAGFQLKGDVE